MTEILFTAGWSTGGDSRGCHAPGGPGGKTHVPVGIYRWRGETSGTWALWGSVVCRNTHFHRFLTQPAPFSALSCSLSPFLSLQPSHVILACSPLPALIPLASFLTLNTLRPFKAECSLQWSQPSPSASGFQFNTPSFFIKMFISLFYFYSVLLSHIEFSVL